MKDYRGPAFNSNKNKDPEWKTSKPHFAQSDRSKYISLNDEKSKDKDISPLLQKKDFRQPELPQAVDSDEPSDKSEYQVAFNKEVVDESKWELSPEEKGDNKTNWSSHKPTTASHYAPAMDKSKHKVNVIEVEEENKEDVADELKSVDKNIREIAKRLTKTLDSFLLFK